MRHVAYISHLNDVVLCCADLLAWTSQEGRIANHWFNRRDESIELPASLQDRVHYIMAFARDCVDVVGKVPLVRAFAMFRTASICTPIFVA